MNKKITELTQANEVNNDDIVMIVQSNENRQVKAEQILVHAYDLILTANVAAGGEITLPFYYKVGGNVLQVYYMGQLLLLSSDDAGTDGHYREVGEANSISNKIKLTTDWSADKGEYFKFVVKGVYENETE